MAPPVLIARLRDLFDATGGDIAKVSDLVTQCVLSGAGILTQDGRLVITLDQLGIDSATLEAMATRILSEEFSKVGIQLPEGWTPAVDPMTLHPGAN